MEDRDKKADEIVEETMKEIFEDLNNSEAFQETEDKNEEIYMDSDDIPSDDDSSTTEELEEDDDFEDSDEEEDDDQADMEEKAARKKKHKKTAAIIIGSIFCVLLLIYVGFAIFFNNHFMFYTKINGIDFSLKNVSQVEAYMEQQVKDYVLTLEESDGDREEINGSDISLE